MDKGFCRLTNSLTNSLTHFLTHSLTHSRTNVLECRRSYYGVHHSPTVNKLLAHSFTHSLTLITHSLTQTITHSPTLNTSWLLTHHSLLLAHHSPLASWKVFVHRRKYLQRSFRVFRRMHPVPRCSSVISIFACWRDEVVPRARHLRSASRLLRRKQRQCELGGFFSRWVDSWGQITSKKISCLRVFKKLMASLRRSRRSWQLSNLCYRIRHRLLVVESELRESEAISSTGSGVSSVTYLMPFGRLSTNSLFRKYNRKLLLFFKYAMTSQPGSERRRLTAVANQTIRGKGYTRGSFGSSSRRLTQDVTRHGDRSLTLNVINEANYDDFDEDMSTNTKAIFFRRCFLRRSLTRFFENMRVEGAEKRRTMAELEKKRLWLQSETERHLATDGLGKVLCFQIALRHTRRAWIVWSGLAQSRMELLRKLQGINTRLGARKWLTLWLIRSRERYIRRYLVLPSPSSTRSSRSSSTSGSSGTSTSGMSAVMRDRGRACVDETVVTLTSDGCTDRGQHGQRSKNERHGRVLCELARRQLPVFTSKQQDETKSLLNFSTETKFSNRTRINSTSRMRSVSGSFTENHSAVSNIASSGLRKSLIVDGPMATDKRTPGGRGYTFMYTLK